MTRNLKRVLTLTAGLITLGTAAIAENKAEVDIKFPFSTVAGTLPAGKYTVQRLNFGAAIPVLVLRNKLTDQAALVVASRLQWEDVRPKMVFRCIDGGCALSRIWLADGSGFELPQPLHARAQKSQVAIVNMRP